MEVKYKGGLLFTSIDISFRGKSKVIDNIVIDTVQPKVLFLQM